jgi:predicted Zn finger-like uncharacterized protein
LQEYFNKVYIGNVGLVVTAMITQCPHCKSKFRTQEGSKAKKAKCSKCNQLFIIESYISEEGKETSKSGSLIQNTLLKKSKNTTKDNSQPRQNPNRNADKYLRSHISHVESISIDADTDFEEMENIAQFLLYAKPLMMAGLAFIVVGIASVIAGVILLYADKDWSLFFIFGAPISLLIGWLFYRKEGMTGMRIQQVLFSLRIPFGPASYRAYEDMIGAAEENKGNELFKLVERDLDCIRRKTSNVITFWPYHLLLRDRYVVIKNNGIIMDSWNNKIIRFFLRGNIQILLKPKGGHVKRIEAYITLGDDHIKTFISRDYLNTVRAWQSQHLSGN